MFQAISIFFPNNYYLPIRENTGIYILETSIKGWITFLPKQFLFYENEVLTVSLLPLHKVLNSYSYYAFLQRLLYHTMNYILFLNFSFFLIFFKENTSFSGCFIAFIIKKLLSLIKKNEVIKVKAGGREAVILWNAKGKTSTILLLLTKEKSLMLIECLLHLSEKSTILEAGIWRLSCACFATSIKHF